jgi:hypothetical protein
MVIGIAITTDTAIITDIVIITGDIGLTGTVCKSSSRFKSKVGDAPSTARRNLADGSEFAV